nr:uncharacterized acetyltransferase At3g50280-like [Ipomoea batatas]
MKVFLLLAFLILDIKDMLDSLSKIISECYITPNPSSEASKKPVFLSVWDLALLSAHYIQKGHLFAKPPSFDLTTFLHSLKHSLSLTLVHFYPLAGRLSTAKGEDGAGFTVFIDCENSPGARFVLASVGLTVSDILSPRDVPLIVQSFFDHDRARNFPGPTITNCWMAINSRSRLDPPLSNNYFGNCGQTVKGTATVGELLEHGLGWAAWKLHQAVASHDDAVIREWVNAWFESAFVYRLGDFFDPCSVMMGSSPRFDMYGVEFGLGKAVAIRSGYANKFDGKVSLYPGIEGGGSMDLEICLSPQCMGALESDMEFMDIKGHLFAKPPSFDLTTFLHTLKHSLSLTLLHFYPLAGRLSTAKGEDGAGFTVFIDCENSPGARFVLASVDLTVAHILSPVDVPLIVQSFFDHDRLDPPLSNEYFGNCAQVVRGTAAAGELLEHGLGWAALKLHRAVASHDDTVIREWVNAWIESAFVYQLGQFFDPYSVMMGSSPRFDMYGVEFGMGKAVAIRSGYANKFDGKVSLYPGVEGGGSTDLEICLSPQSMGALESDMAFMDTVA